MGADLVKGIANAGGGGERKDGRRKGNELSSVFSKPSVEFINGIANSLTFQGTFKY